MLKKTEIDVNSQVMHSVIIVFCLFPALLFSQSFSLIDGDKFKLEKKLFSENKWVEIEKHPSAEEKLKHLIRDNKRLIVLILKSSSKSASAVREGFKDFVLHYQTEPQTLDMHFAIVLIHKQGSATRPSQYIYNQIPSVPYIFPYIQVYYDGQKMSGVEKKDGVPRYISLVKLKQIYDFAESFRDGVDHYKHRKRCAAQLDDYEDLEENYQGPYSLYDKVSRKTREFRKRHESAYNYQLTNLTLSCAVDYLYILDVYDNE